LETIMQSVPVMETAQRNRLTVHLPALRDRLERERAFRLEQLAELGSTSRPGDDALREVTEQIAAAATMALNDIEIALLRMDVGSYGRCQTCHADIPIRLLEAIPQLRLCAACQQAVARIDLVEVWGHGSFPASDPPANW
jgi:DnaK suppressor protein